MALAANFAEVCLSLLRNSCDNDVAHWLFRSVIYICIYIYVYIYRGLQLWQHYTCRFSLWVRDAGLAFFKPRKHCHIWWLMIYLTLSSEEILVSLARNPKLIGPQTFADKIWVVPVKLLCISMFNISKIGHKSILGTVKAKKILWHMHSAPVSKFKHFQWRNFWWELLYFWNVCHFHGWAPELITQVWSVWLLPERLHKSW